MMTRLFATTCLFLFAERALSAQLSPSDMATVNKYLTGAGIGSCINATSTGDLYPSINALSHTGGGFYVRKTASGEGFQLDDGLFVTDQSAGSDFELPLGFKLEERILDTIEAHKLGDNFKLLLEPVKETNPTAGGVKLFHAQDIPLNAAIVSTLGRDVDLSVVGGDILAALNTAQLDDVTKSSANQIWINALGGNIAYSLLSLNGVHFSHGPNSGLIGITIPASSFHQTDLTFVRTQILRVVLSYAFSADYIRVSAAAPNKPQNRREANEVQGYGSTGYCEYMYTHGFSGKGQIIGVTDTGIDLNHMSFYDENRNAKNCYFDTGYTSIASSCPGQDSISYQGESSAAGLTGYVDVPINTEARKVVMYLNYADKVEGVNAGHGTGVAGSIAGSILSPSNAPKCPDTSGRIDGLAYNSKIAFFDASEVSQSATEEAQLSNTLTLPYANTYDMFRAAYGAGARIYVLPYGSSNYGAYATEAEEIDLFMSDYPDMLIIAAAGNNGEDADSSVMSPGVSKNALTVGAMNHAYANVDSTSASGVCDTNIQKPDLVAPGHSVATSNSEKPTTQSSTFLPVYPQCTSTKKSGTSEAAAFVAGAAALVREYLTDGYYEGNGVKTTPCVGPTCSPSAATVKGVLLASSSYITGTKEPTNHLGLDSRQGFGYLQLEKTLGFTNEKKNNLTIHTDSFLQSDAKGLVKTYSVTVEDSSQPLVVVLSYTDDAKSVTGLKRSVVNSLSLRVCNVGDITTCTTPGANTEGLLEYSNVQRVTIPNPSGTYTIGVVKTGSEYDPALENYTTAYSDGSQKYTVVSVYATTAVKANLCCPPNAAFGIGGVDCLYTSQIVMIALTLFVFVVACIVGIKSCVDAKKSGKKISQKETEMTKTK